MLRQALAVHYLGLLEAILDVEVDLLHHREIIQGAIVDLTPLGGLRFIGLLLIKMVAVFDR